MCAEKMQYIIQAIVLDLAMGLAGMGSKDSILFTVCNDGDVVYAGFTGFCPGLMVLKKIFPAYKGEGNK